MRRLSIQDAKTQLAHQDLDACTPTLARTNDNGINLLGHTFGSERAGPHGMELDLLGWPVKEPDEKGSDDGCEHQEPQGDDSLMLREKGEEWRKGRCKLHDGSLRCWMLMLCSVEVVGFCFL